MVNAFVNTGGGCLFVGIDDEWAVKGVAMGEVDYDATQRAVMEGLAMWQPFSDELVQVIEEWRAFPMVRKNGEAVEGKAVIRVVVGGPLLDEDGERILFATADGKKFRKNFNYITNVVDM